MSIDLKRPKQGPMWKFNLLRGKGMSLMWNLRSHMLGVIKLKEDSSRPKIKLMGPKTKKRWDLAGKKGGKRMQRFVCYLFMFYYYLSISNEIRLQTFLKNSKFSLQNVDSRGRVGRPSLYLSQVWSTRDANFVCFSFILYK